MLRSGPYRFYSYSHEPNEPPHIHVVEPTSRSANGPNRPHLDRSWNTRIGLTSHERIRWS